MTATFSDKTLLFFRFDTYFTDFLSSSGEDSNDLAFRCCTGLEPIRKVVNAC